MGLATILDEVDEDVEDEHEDQRSVLDDSVKQYLKEIGTYPLLTGQQELQLAERIALWRPNGTAEAHRSKPSPRCKYCESVMPTRVFHCLT